MSKEWDYWEARDAWESSYYIVKDPPIAWGFMFDGQLVYGGEDFDIGFTYEEMLALHETVDKEVPCWIAKSYGVGDICPEEVNWDKDAPIEWPRPKRTCTPDKPCWGTEHCRAQATRPRDMQEIIGLVRSLAKRPLSPIRAKYLEEYKREKEMRKRLAERSRAETQGISAENPAEPPPQPAMPSTPQVLVKRSETLDNPVAKPAETPSKPAMPSTPQVLVEKPAIPWIALEEVPEPANHGLAAFWAFVKSLWKKASGGPERERPPSST